MKILLADRRDRDRPRQSGSGDDEIWRIKDFDRIEDHKIVFCKKLTT
jgi:hypothetical protein